jgi:histidine triad (HIT) family protein
VSYPFCDIVAGKGPASVIYQDDAIMAFMTLRPFAPGECTVIPRQHIDHFTDVPDDLSERIMVVSQRIGRRIRTVFSPERVGMVVHGYGVPHAHLILVPQHGPFDITSARYAYIDNGQIAFGMKSIPLAPRSALDEHARRLSAAFGAAT